MPRVPKKLAVIKEPDGLRGNVPSRLVGRRDRVFAAYLDTLNPRANENIQQALAACPDVPFQAFLEKVMTPRYDEFFDLTRRGNHQAHSAAKGQVGITQKSAPV